MDSQTYIETRITVLEQEIKVLKSLLHTQKKQTRATGKHRTVLEGRKKHKMVSDKKVRDYVVAKGSVTAYEVAAALGISKNTALRKLEKFEQRKMVEKVTVVRPNRFDYIDPKSVKGPNRKPRGEAEAPKFHSTATKTRAPSKRSFPKTNNKEINDVLRKAKKEDWRIERTGSHIKALAPDGVGQVIVALTPSDHRAIENTIAEFKRAGLTV